MEKGRGESPTKRSLCLNTLSLSTSERLILHSAELSAKKLNDLSELNELSEEKELSKLTSKQNNEWRKFGIEQLMHRWE